MCRNLQRTVLLLCLCMFPLQLHAASPERLDVFVSIPPLKWLCEQVAGDQVTLHLLLSKGQEPHSFEPSPRQIRALSRARLFFTAGLVFEQELSRRFAAGNLALQIVDTSKDIEKIAMDGAVHGHGGEAFDPHVWLSPVNLKSMAKLMTVALVRADPGRKAFYEENLEKLEKRLDTLDKQIAAKLAPYRGSSFFVFHPAFGYFAHHYHLRQVAVEMGGKSPTPKQLFSLIRKARKEGVRVLFVQPQFDPRSAQRVASAIGGTVLPLNPLAENSIENMDAMATEIVSALSGRSQ